MMLLLYFFFVMVVLVVVIVVTADVSYVSSTHSLYDLNAYTKATAHIY